MHDLTSQSARRRTRYTCLLLLPLAATMFAGCSRFFRINFGSQASSGFPASVTAQMAADLGRVGITCRDPSLMKPSDSRRLTRTELMNTLIAAFGGSIYTEVGDAVALLPNDDITKDPDSLLATYGDSELETLDNLSKKLARVVVSSPANLQAVAGACATASPMTMDCAMKFIADFGKRAFRRPLSGGDLAFFQSIYTAAGAGSTGVGNVVSAMVTSPEFLYHVETGVPGGTDARFTLTNHEVASRISYFLTDGPPDAELMAAADAGTVRSPAVLNAQVERLLGSAAGKTKIRQFISYWLTLSVFQGLPSTAAFLGGVKTDGLADEMRTELNDFVDYIVYQKRGSYRDLLTSRRSFAKSDTLAKIYGQPRPLASATDELSTDDFHMGVLLRAPVLGFGAPETHPIIRGAFYNRRVLCNEIASPGPKDLADRNSANFVADPLHYSSMEMVRQRTSPTSCQNCHSQINPVATAFEGIDNLGRARTVEVMYDGSGNELARHPVSAAGSVTFADGKTAAFKDGPEFVSQLASSVTGPSCFARHLHRYFHKSREASEDGCLLGGTYAALQSQNGGILDAIKASLVNRYIDQRQTQ